MKKLGLALLLAAVAFVLLGTGGCASTRCLAGAGGLPRSTATQLSAADEVCLQAFEWKPATPEVRGVVLIIHGIRDHASRYAALAEALTVRGFVVVSHDLRGHGHSGGSRQRFDSMEQLLGDVDLVVQRARASNPNKPVFIYGHSLGGLIATHYTLAHQPQLAGLVLSGAALKLPDSVTPGQVSAARFFGTVLPGLPAQPVADDGFVSTPEALEDFMKDPLIAHANLPARSAKAGIEGIEALSPREEELTVPVLIMHGAEDHQTSIEGSRELARRAKSADKTLVLYERQAHDLIHEPDRQKVISDVTAWLVSHAP
jgi:acylglycerol lipase